MRAGVAEVGGDRVCAVAVLDRTQACGGEVEGLWPGDRHPLIPDVLDGVAQPVRVLVEVHQRGRLGADVAPGHHVVRIAGDP